MEKTELLYCVNHLDHLEDGKLQEFVRDWLIMSRLLLEPVEMVIDGVRQPFDLMDLHQMIDLLHVKEDCRIRLINGSQEATLHILGHSLVEKTLITYQVFKYWEMIYFDYLKERVKDYGVFGYLRSYDEFLYHNVSDPKKRQDFQATEETDKLPKMKNNNGDIIIDCNQFSGYDVFYKGFCLTSCWRIFFGPAYQQFFPQQLLLEIQQVDRAEKLGNGVFIEIFKHPLHWDEVSNLHYQKMFRNQLGIAQLSYTNGVGVLEQPFIEFAYDKSMVQTVQYQNDLFQPIEKKKATFFVTRTYDYLKDDYSVTRMKGSLNALAYFPWIDNENKQMMNFKVLYPELTVDQGIAAYRYYIEDYLDIKITDLQLKDYLPVLQLFIPKKSIDNFPLNELKNAIPGISIQEVKQKTEGISLLLKNESQKLKVLFIPQKFETKQKQMRIVDI